MQLPYVGTSSAAALAPLAARSSAAAPISPVGSRRLAAVDLNNGSGRSGFVPACRQCRFLAEILLNLFVDKPAPELLLLD